MKTKSIIFSICVLVLVFDSCKKKTDNNNNPPYNPSARIKTLTTFSAALNETDTLHYDSNNRLSLFSASNGSTTQYTYTGNNVYEDHYDSTGYLYLAYAYTLNSSSLVDSAVENYNGTYYYIKYLYDVNGYLIGKNMYDATNTLYTTYAWTITNGDATTYVNKDPAGNTLTSQTSTFATDKTNTVTNETGGQAYFGTTSKNPVQTVVTSSSGTTNTFNYQYTIDANGRIVGMTASQGGTAILTQAYTYY
jgi:YD repeat-containing protein